jgi:TPR repeat protein
MESERGSAGQAGAQLSLALWHFQGAEGLQLDEAKAAGWLLKAAALGLDAAQNLLAACYYTGTGLTQNYALATEWGIKAADQGNFYAQFTVGKWYAQGLTDKKDLPLGKRYLELSAAHGNADAVGLLRELRNCVACGELDVHHMICSRCHNRRYCNASCQLRHWNDPTDPHKLNCVKRRE